MRSFTKVFRIGFLGVLIPLRREYAIAADRLKGETCAANSGKEINKAKRHDFFNAPYAGPGDGCLSGATGGFLHFFSLRSGVPTVWRNALRQPNLLLHLTHRLGDDGQEAGGTVAEDVVHFMR